MLPAMDERPRRSMYASASLPPSTMPIRTSWGSAVMRMRLVWVMVFLSAHAAARWRGGRERALISVPAPGRGPRGAVLPEETAQLRGRATGRGRLGGRREAGGQRAHERSEPQGALVAMAAAASPGFRRRRHDAPGSHWLEPHGPQHSEGPHAPRSRW